MSTAEDRALPATSPEEIGQPVDEQRTARNVVTLVVAAAAMVATFPGRTFGLGFVEAQLTRDLQLSELEFSHINLWATLIGALACFPTGRLIDRYGLRVVLFGTALALGVVTRGMAGVTTTSMLLILITLTRAFGQSAMSVVSIAIVGKSFDRRQTWPMAAFSLWMTIGFMASVGMVGSSVKEAGWRYAWSGIGIAVLCLAPAAWLLPKTLPMFADESSEATVGRGFTLRQALATPAFWLFASATSLFGLVAAGITLFNGKILAERGFDYATYYQTAVIAAPFGLLGQAACGGLARRWTYQRLTTLGMTLYAVSLLGLTWIDTKQQLIAVSTLTSFSGGMITVIFFAVFPRLFGRRELGRIQGAAQMLTVFASALGPILFGASIEFTGSYRPAIIGMAFIVLLVGWAAVFVASPKLSEENASV
ncbi:MAG: MFS transporter [Planctomycetia bacterium]|nr:MFS transporter [Planctomycetia bacterium]